MILKKQNKIDWEISELEIINKFLQSELFKDRSRELIVRLALFVAIKEPKGLDSTFKTTDDFNSLFDLLNLQILLKKIIVPQPKQGKKLYKKKKLNLN